MLVAAQYSYSGNIWSNLVSIVIAVLVIAGLWKTFDKAGRPGWAAIIPFYNFYMLCKVAGRPGWWLILWFIPIVDIIVLLIVSIDVAKQFGKGAGYGIGLWILPFIFYRMLGFGQDQYQGQPA